MAKFAGNLTTFPPRTPRLREVLLINTSTKRKRVSFSHGFLTHSLARRACTGSDPQNLILAWDRPCNRRFHLLLQTLDGSNVANAGRFFRDTQP